jgi:hypothetical protein
MYVAKVPNWNSPRPYLLREGYREGGKVKTRPLANISHWPIGRIERCRVLRDEVLENVGQALTELRSLPHEHVAAAVAIGFRLPDDPLVRPQS